MKIFRWAGLVAWIVLGYVPHLVFPLSSFGQETHNFFPLKKGNYWTYQGVVRWTDGVRRRVLEKQMTWTMEVREVTTRGNISAAVIAGHPADLAWYEEGKTPGKYVIVKVENKYYLFDAVRGRKILKRLKDVHDSLHNLVSSGDQFLENPLKPLQSFGRVVNLPREDSLYSWVVDSQEEQSSTMVYHLSFRSLPDHTTVDFVPGIGITHYRYTHHGTISGADMKLVDYFSG